MTNENALKRRSGLAVFLITIITFGIYSIVWYAKTRGELNRSGAHVMTTWWILCPFGVFWYFWSFAKGVLQVTGLGVGGNYALLLLLGNLGQGIVQARINGASAPVVAVPAVAALS